MQQHHLARQIFEAVDAPAGDAGGLRAAHQVVSVYLTYVEASGRALGTEPAQVEAEIAIGLRRLRDALLTGQRARSGPAAVAIGEIVIRLGALIQGKRVVSAAL